MAIYTTKVTIRLRHTMGSKYLSYFIEYFSSVVRIEGFRLHFVTVGTVTTMKFTKSESTKSESTSYITTDFGYFEGSRNFKRVDFKSYYSNYMFKKVRVPATNINFGYKRSLTTIYSARKSSALYYYYTYYY